jgi:type IV pilus assembly protein PilN
VKLRVPVNLASEPFVGTRRVVVGTITAAVLLTGSLALLVSLSLMERGQADQVSREIAQLESRMKTLSAERARLESILRRPENAAVLERSQFLNQLLYAKGISWTRLFDDLEKVLPHNVRLVSIRPQVNAQSQVMLDMVVGAESEQPVIQFLVRLENSPQFGLTTPHNRMPPTQSEPLLRWRFSANYTQKLDAPAAPAAEGGSL